MSWRNKFAASCLCLWLGACGFEPLLEQKDTQQDLSRVDILPLQGREGQWFHNDLEDLFYGSSGLQSPDYLLQTQISMQTLPVLVDPNGKIHRYRVKITSPFTLKRKADLHVIEQGVVQRTVSYTMSDSDYSSYVAPQDAIRRGLHAMAEEYQLRIATLLRKQTP